jgi:negative regulator of sigma E activity
MTAKDAQEKLFEYLDGGLAPDERDQIAELLQDDPQLRQCWQATQALEGVLHEQAWIRPGPGFTSHVLALAACHRRKVQPFWVRAWEPAKVAVSAATLGVMLVLQGQSLTGWVSRLLENAGQWVDGATGITLFAVHPVVLLGLVAPLLAGGYATCVLAGRCRLSS